MKRYKHTFRGWLNVETGELVDNRLLVDELDWLWDTLYYQTTIKCDVEPVDFALTIARGRLISVSKEVIRYLPLLPVRVDPMFEEIARFQIEGRMAIVHAMRIPSEYFEGQRP